MNLEIGFFRAVTDIQEGLVSVRLVERSFRRWQYNKAIAVYLKQHCTSSSSSLESSMYFYIEQNALYSDRNNAFLEHVQEKHNSRGKTYPLQEVTLFST